MHINKRNGDLKHFRKLLEIFDIHEARIRCGHREPIRIEENLKRKFHNIPRDLIMGYLNLHI